MGRFMVFSLPRSRSCWLSSFLSYQGRNCGHDLLVHSDSIAEFERKFNSRIGSCETGAMLGWKLIVSRFPSIKLVVIRRPVEEVDRSIRAKGVVVPYHILVERDEMLEALAQLPRVRQYQFCDLNQEEVVREIFEYCLGLEWDNEWWNGLRDINIQLDFHKRISELQYRADALQQLTNEVLMESSKIGSEACLRLN